MDKIKDVLDRHLKGVSPTKVESLAGKLSGLPAERALLMLDIGVGLASSSLRAALEFYRVGPDAARLMDTESLRPWGEIGRRLVTINADVAMSFFQTSAQVLEDIPASLRGPVLTLCERQVMISSGVALDCFRSAPQMLQGIADDRIAVRLYQIGCEIARRSATQSAELLSASPRIISYLRGDHRGPIRGPAQRSSQSSSGETESSVERSRLIDRVLDLTAIFAHRAGGMATEFFSTLPHTLPDVNAGVQLELLENTETFLERGGGAALQYFYVAGQALTKTGPQALKQWTALALKIASQGNAAIYYFLKITPKVITDLATLGRHRADELAREVLTVVDEVASENIFLAIECFKSSPQALQLGSLEQFANWARTGLALQAGDQRRVRAYYALETKASQQSLKESSGGLTLDQVIHTLRLYAEGLTGRELSVNPASGFHLSQFPQEPQFGDGKTINLPTVIAEFDDEPSNFRLYKVLTAQAAGRIEFGTYDAGTPDLQDIMKKVEANFARSEGRETMPEQSVNFAVVLSRFPNVEFATRLFTVLETARVEWKLRQTYRGLCRDLDFIQARLSQVRSPIETLPPDQAVAELLFQIALSGETAEHAREAAPGMSRLFENILERYVRRPDATVADTLAAVHEVYRIVVRESMQSAEQPSQTSSSEPEESQAAQDLDLQAALDEALLEEHSQTRRGPSNPFNVRTRSMAARVSPDAELSDEGHIHKSSGESDLEPGDRAYYYDEWDREIADFRIEWCRVIEKAARRGGRQFVEYVRSYYGPLISSVRSQFQRLRPEALKKIRNEIDGEDFDLQAVIDYALDRRTSGRVSERLYIRRLHKQRDVAVSFLLDMSSSTARTVGRTGGRGLPPHSAKRIIDIEKEGLVLMSEALEAVGDLYSIQGFTSEGRHQVKFYIVKDFDDEHGPAVEARIGGITYQNNTRLGAAIRHATARLMAQETQTKLLIVLSDGRPYDHDYGDSRYAREDTKVALRQARISGIVPFCITIDRESEIQLRDMYGEVGYIIIDDILSLPERLPAIYRRLTQ
jgi:hypothetical protein